MHGMHEEHIKPGGCCHQCDTVAVEVNSRYRCAVKATVKACEDSLKKKMMSSIDTVVGMFLILK